MCRWKSPSTHLRALGSRSNQTTNARSGPIRGLAALAFVLCLVCLTVAAVAKERREVLGIFERGKELGAIEVLIDGGVHHLPLEEFAGLVAARIEPGEDGKTVYFVTKIGRVAIAEQYLSEHDAMVFVSQRFLEERLSATVKFDEEEYALELDLPWKAKGAGTNKHLTSQADVIKPDARPSRFGLSTIHGNSYFELDQDYTEWFHNMKLTGHAFGGVWQMAYEDDLENERRLRDFIWLKELEEGRWVQIGHQNISLHPVLRSIEMTGAQYAWTNNPQEFRQQRFHPGEIISRHGRQQRSFRGNGPVGGFAEIWINDRKQGTTTIDLNGQFEFRNIALGGLQSEIEIRTYDRRNPGTPVDVERRTIALSDLMLAPGTFNMLSGAGIGGNLVDDQLNEYSSSDDDDEPIAFVQLRYGLYEDITLETAVEITDERASAVVGGVARVSDNMIASAAVGIDNEGHLAYDLEADWKLKPFHVTLRSNWREENFGDDDRPTEWDHWLNASYQYSENLEFGIISRYNDEDKSFALPYVYWRPTDDISLRARPNSNGDYRYDARYRYSRDTRFSLSHDHQTILALDTRLTEDLGLVADYRTGGDLADRATVGLTGSTLFDYDVSWRLGGVFMEDDIGLEGYARSEITPGVYGFVEARTTEAPFRNYFSNSSNDSEADMRVRFGVSYDLAVSENGFGPALRPSVHPTRGGVTGRIDGAGLVDDRELKNIPILIDGREVTRTTEGGKFYIPDLRKGIHAIEVDDGELPIELVAKGRTINAEIAPGALTDVTFEVKAEYGAAGRITDASGGAVADLTLSVLDAQGAEVARLSSNEFGYFRIDGLAPGSYQIRKSGVDGPEGAILRRFTVRNDYVFGVDIHLS